ncbi:MAG: hypothetical protein AYL28_002120 [Candidatus Bathyarchaeota archaeon B23]|nr:MAG: hypothetical protein AYL28_002120 [Candidatus Bathyarchaeota archaeon B23]
MRRIVEIALCGVMAALVCVTTLLIQVPIPPTRGYINVGDAMIMVSALAFGPLVGGFAGGVGSALADILGGWAHWAPFTLLIKGIEGVLAGLIVRRGGSKNYMLLLAWAVGCGEMVLGYLTVEALLYGVGPALVEAPGNLIQMLAGGVVGIPVAVAVKRRMRIQ